MYLIVCPTFFKAKIQNYVVIILFDEVFYKLFNKGYKLHCEFHYYYYNCYYYYDPIQRERERFRVGSDNKLYTYVFYKVCERVKKNV